MKYGDPYAAIVGNAADYRSVDRDVGIEKEEMKITLHKGCCCFLL